MNQYKLYAKNNIVVNESQKLKESISKIQVEEKVVDISDDKENIVNEARTEKIKMITDIQSLIKQYRDMKKSK